jgi:hypothetical protein
MKVQWDFSELNKFANRLVTSDLDNTFKRITQEIAKVLLRHMRGLTPVDKTHKLIDGWNGNAFVVIPMADGFKVEIVNKTEYAAWVNDGHRVRNRPEGEYLQVHKRIKVPTPHKWQKPVSNYYVFGHFFLEESIYEFTDGTDSIRRTIKEKLREWWEWCFSG